MTGSDLDNGGFIRRVFESRPSRERLVGIEAATVRAGEKRLWLKVASGAVEI